MFGWFRRKSKQVAGENPTCRSCYYYGCLKSETKLNSDKTVTKGGEIKYEWCNKGDFYLDDIEPCELYRRLRYGEHRSAKIKPPPNTVMRGGSGIKRPD